MRRSNLQWVQYRLGWSCGSELARDSASSRARSLPNKAPGGVGSKNPVYLYSTSATVAVLVLLLKAVNAVPPKMSAAPTSSCTAKRS